MSPHDARQIRVLRVIARMNVGGPAVQISGLMRGLDEGKFLQCLVTGYCEPTEQDYLQNVAKDISVTRIFGFGARVNLINDLRAWVELTKIIRKFKPDIVHTHTFKAGFLGRLASITSGQKSIRVHTFHGHLLYGYFSFSRNKLIIFIEKFLGKFTHHLIAVGVRVKSDLIGVGIGAEDKFSVIPPGIILGNQLEKVEAKKLLNLDPEQLQCSFIGRLAQIKRPDRFVEVVREVKRRKIPISFFVAGGGEMESNIRAIASADQLPIVFLGWRNDIETLLSASDLILLTSDNEGTPVSLIQAGLFGIPSVSTNVGSISEVIKDGETGILVDSNVKVLCDALEKLAYNKELREKFGSQAKRYTSSEFAVGRLVLDHEKLYEDLIRNTRAARN